MKTVSEQSGFTITEVIIVLGIVGALFVLAFLSINGQQRKTEFYQAVNDVQSVVNTALNEVTSGSYGDTRNFSCTTTGSGVGASVQISSSATGQQGSNTGCIFMGEVMQFGILGTSPQQYIKYPIAGIQGSIYTLTTALWCPTDGSDPNCQSPAYPVAIAPGNSTNKLGADGKAFPDASIKDILHNGLTVQCMDYLPTIPSPAPSSVCAGPNNPSVGTSIGAVGFIVQLGSYTTYNAFNAGISSTVLDSGPIQVDLIPISGSAINTTFGNAVDNINNSWATSSPNPVGGVQICLTSAGTAQSGLLTISDNGQTPTTSLVIKEGNNC